MFNTKNISFKEEAYRFLFYFEKPYLRRLWFSPGGYYGNLKASFGNVGLFVQFLGQIASSVSLLQELL